MENQTSSSHGKIGLAGALFLIFLTLKLCGVIQWSWWWVTAPLWIPAALFFSISLAFLLWLFLGGE